VIASDGPAMHVPANSNDSIPVEAAGIVERDGEYTIQYRSPNDSESQLGAAAK
jgi:hypothetical protein